MNRKRFAAFALALALAFNLGTASFAEAGDALPAPAPTEAAVPTGPAPTAPEEGLTVDADNTAEPADALPTSAPAQTAAPAGQAADEAVPAADKLTRTQVDEWAKDKNIAWYIKTADGSMQDESKISVGESFDANFDFFQFDPVSNMHSRDLTAADLDTAFGAGNWQVAVDCVSGPCELQAMTIEQGEIGDRLEVKQVVLPTAEGVIELRAQLKISVSDSDEPYVFSRTAPFTVGNAQGGDVPDVPSDLPKLGTPTNLQWNTSYVYTSNPDGTWQQASQPVNGYIAFRLVEECEGTYEITVCRDGAVVESSQWSGLFDDPPFAVANSSHMFSIPMLDKFSESGSYTFSVRALGDGVNYADGDAAVSEPFAYTRPTAVLGTVTDLAWDESNPTTLRFMMPAYGDGFAYTVYYRQDVNHTPQQCGSGAQAPSGDASPQPYAMELDISDSIREPGLYSVSIMATSGDITKFANSTVSVCSAEKDFSANFAEVNDIVGQNTAGLIDGTLTPEQVKENLANTDTQILRAAMLNQEEDTYDQVNMLEGVYKEKTGIQVKVDVEPEAGVEGGVSVVGAAFNAAEGQRLITLKVDRPEQAGRLKDAALRSVLEVSMELEGAPAGKLAVPICITMPAPADVNERALRIYHYHADGSVETIWPQWIYGDGMPMIRFTLTSFSDFVFAVEDEDEAQPSTPPQVPGAADGSGTSIPKSPKTGQW